jgi:protein-tyrosine phosphatase
MSPADFRRFDLLIAMDRTNLRELLALAPDEEAAEKVRLLREFDPAAGGDLDVPDPYYGGDRGFENVLDMVEAACRGLLDELRAADRA